MTNGVATLETYDAFAIVAPGLEALGLGELRALGLKRARAIEGGVQFRGSSEDLYRVNLHSHVVSRVVVRIADFTATSFSELERRLNRVNWQRWIAPLAATRIRVTCRKSKLYHSDAVGERVTGVLGKVIGSAPTVYSREEEERPNPAAIPAQLVLVRLDHDRCTISLDSSGHLLHMRGYRAEAGIAPLRETIAAAMLLAAAWHHDSDIIDPMCGSGTIAIEAAMIARSIPPGLKRSFAFSRWPDFDRDVWGQVRDLAKAMSRKAAGVKITGSDRDEGAVRASVENAKRAGVEGDIEFIRRTISECVPTGDRGLILTNPPYGVRVGDRDGLRDLYARFGAVMRERFHGWSVGFLSADRRLEGQLQVHLKELLAFSNGGIRVRMMFGKI
jgi:putative N6-adenine-specific DNA methylase